ncbi:MAG: hypothetical protein QW390_03615 [Candidatus Bathyarchaeia archaeon]
MKTGVMGGPRWLLTSGGFFIASSLLLLAFAALYDPGGFVTYVLAALGLITGFSVIFRRRLGVYSAAIGIPLAVVVSAAALRYSVRVGGFNPGLSGLIFNTMLILYPLLWLILGVIIIDNREIFT